MSKLSQHIILKRAKKVYEIIKTNDIEDTVYTFNEDEFVEFEKMYIEMYQNKKIEALKLFDKFIESNTTLDLEGMSIYDVYPLLEDNSHILKVLLSLESVMYENIKIINKKLEDIANILENADKSMTIEEREKLKNEINSASELDDENKLKQLLNGYLANALNKRVD